MTQSRLARDRELRAMTPPMDWEAIASEGANRLAAEWNNTKGKSVAHLLKCQAGIGHARSSPSARGLILFTAYILSLAPGIALAVSLNA